MQQVDTPHPDQEVNVEEQKLFIYEYFHSKYPTTLESLQSKKKVPLEAMEEEPEKKLAGAPRNNIALNGEIRYWHCTVPKCPKKNFAFSMKNKNKYHAEM